MAFILIARVMRVHRVYQLWTSVQSSAIADGRQGSPEWCDDLCRATPCSGAAPSALEPGSPARPVLPHRLAATGGLDDDIHGRAQHPQAGQKIDPPHQPHASPERLGEDE